MARFKTPDTALIIFVIIALAAVMTWVIPPGEFAKETITVEGAGEREVVVPGSYERVEGDSKGWSAQLLHSVVVVFQAPIRGFTDPDAAPIIAFVLLVGGAFAVLQQTGAVDASLRRLVRRARSSSTFEALLIPLFMAVFSLGGAVFGMSEETIPFVLIFVPLALALGYDSIVGAAIPFVGAAAGFAAAFLNPFTVGVAQGIAGVPLFSGLYFRLALWVIVTGVIITYVTLYARRIRRDPRLSPVYAIDAKKRAEGMHVDAEDATFTKRQKAVLLVFFLGLAVLVVGVLRFGWYITEIAALFVALGVAMGIAGGLGANETAKAFMTGARDLIGAALIIALARGILVVLEDGQVIDTILHGLASTLGETGAVGSGMAMFGAQTVINFFVPSGSGQAALTMPLMAPLSDLVGVTRQTAVLAFQMGDGFTNLIIPTSAVLMGALSLAGVPWTKWARWILPLQIGLFALGLVAVAVAVLVGF